MDLNRSILSDIIMHNKYARWNDKLLRRETYEECIDRNKNMHLERFPELTEQIEEAYKLVYSKMVLPSMRALQFSGKPIKIAPNRLFNCIYLPIDDFRAFGEVMFLLLGGSGVGYSVQRHHIENLPEINKPTKSRRYLVADSIEGWADAIKVLFKAYFFNIISYFWRAVCKKLDVKLIFQK
jgi:ribonucleoside-diphosphate reductase alpha chain